MASLRPESTLTAGQRFALVAVLVLAMTSFCAVLWKSRRPATLTATEQVTITEFQTIPPVKADNDTSAKSKTGHYKSKKSKTGKKKSGSKQKEAAPAPPPRDITSETVSPDPPGYTKRLR